MVRDEFDAGKIAFESAVKIAATGNQREDAWPGADAHARSAGIVESDFASSTWPSGPEPA
jgi:hypothetical protein